MKKVALCLLPICAALAHFVNYLILSSHWSETSKAISLILSSCVFSSAALLVILVSLGTWNIIKRPAGSNHLATLAKKEKEIAEKSSKAGTQTSENQYDSLLRRLELSQLADYHK